MALPLQRRGPAAIAWAWSCGGQDSAVEVIMKGADVPGLGSTIAVAVVGLVDRRISTGALHHNQNARVTMLCQTLATQVML